jgi:hypothetical protein
MIVGSAPVDPVAWTRQRFWAEQIPATVMAGPTGGIMAFFDTGERLTFPTMDAVTWFLTGWQMGSEAPAALEEPTLAPAVAAEPGEGPPTEGEE